VRELEESINLSAWLGCSVEQAFNMFTNKEHLMSWLPIVSNVEPKIGGKFELSWASGSKKTKKLNKKKTTIGCKILGYEPNKYLAFEWKGPTNGSSMNLSQHQTYITVYFLPMDTKKRSKNQFTHVHLTLTGLKDFDEVEEVKAWFEDNWTSAFEKLIEHVNDVCT
jgi:uncharacterized protein YndB with AHSA1/START domain